MLYHVNKETGETGPCGATKGKCPFGGADEHFTSDYAARLHYENLMSSGSLTAQKKDGRSIRGNWADLELYRSQIPDTSEVFVHPQGKIAFTNPYGRLIVMKAGKKASTSGSLDDLRAGRGAWKQVKAAHERLPSKEDYQSQYGGTPVVSVAGAKVPLAATLNEREQANVNAGYPKDSPYDPRKSEINGSFERKYDYRNPYSILPLGKRGNPFKLKEMKPGEKLRYWNDRNPDGTEKMDSTFEVWADDAGHYKAVVTYGTDVTKLGSTSAFSHDQSGARMGDKWTMIGAFRPQEDGAIVGNVPNVSMPIYTYK